MIYLVSQNGVLHSKDQGRTYEACNLDDARTVPMAKEDAAKFLTGSEWAYHVRSMGRILRVRRSCRRCFPEVAVG